MSVQDYFGTRRELLDRHLAGLSDRVAMPEQLAPAVRHAMRLRGKRVRGILTITAAESEGLAVEKAIGAGTAFEMIHSSSLILDDLPSMDDALLRRGEPALHRQVGEDLAILASVALLNHAYGLIAESHTAAAPRRWPLNVVIDRVVSAVGWDGTIGGEAVDLHSDNSALDFSTLEYIHSRKTGTLFVAAGAVGAMLANASEATVARLEIFAKNLGLAFQITDDVLDVTATAEELGKDVGKDAQKLTFVKLAGVEGARQLANELVETSLAAIEPLGSKASHLREFALMVRDRSK